MLEYESVQSLEKLVLDNEAVMVAGRLTRGFDKDPAATQALAEGVLEKRGNFLALKHTRQNYRKEIRIPSVWDLEPRARAAKQALLEKAHATVQEILSTHAPKLLEGDQVEKLDNVLAKLYRQHNLKLGKPNI
jgi:trimethylamine--corrinoid protein Co-methyltransferase